jgi:predicted DNA binding CopG/RHH family protein
MAGGVRGLFYRPVTRPVTIRLSAPDVAMARRLSKTKAMPYQTYIKMLLHEALERAASKQQAPRSR